MPDTSVRPKVLLTRRIPSSSFALIEHRCEVEVHDQPGPLSAEELTRRIADKDGLISVVTDKITAEVLDAAIIGIVDQIDYRGDL